MAMMANASANDLQLLTMPVNIFQNENNTTGGATTLTIPPPKMTINETNTSSSSSSLPVVETTTLDERWNSFTSANDLLTPVNLFQDDPVNYIGKDDEFAQHLNCSPLANNTSPD